jgi:hypothetical protein
MNRLYFEISGSAMRSGVNQDGKVYNFICPTQLNERFEAYLIDLSQMKSGSPLQVAVQKDDYETIRKSLVAPAEKSP